MLPFMNREPDKERVRAAFLREEADAVPYWEAAVDRRNLAHIFEREDVPDLSWSLSLEDQIQLARLSGQDVIVGGGAIIGYPRVREKDGSFRLLERGELKTWEMLERLEPYTDEEIRQHVRPIEKSFDAVAGSRMGVIAGSGNIWQGAWMAVGFDDFMMKLLTEPEFIRRVIACFAEPQVRSARLLAEYPLTFFLLGDNIATTKGALVDPEMFRPYWIPWVRKILEPFQSKGTPLLFNTDGKMDWVMDDIVGLGFHAINPVDPNGNDIFEVKAEYGNRLCLVGGINQAWPLSFGTPEEVDLTVRDCIERLGEGGGYIVSSSHEIGDNVPPENWVAMVRAVEKYGSRRGV